MTHITRRLAHRIPRLSTNIRAARISSPGPGPVQVASDVPPRQQLLLLSDGANRITCLCSIIADRPYRTPRDYRAVSSDETAASRSRHAYFARLRRTFRELDLIAFASASARIIYIPDWPNRINPYLDMSEQICVDRNLD